MLRRGMRGRSRLRVTQFGPDGKGAERRAPGVVRAGAPQPPVGAVATVGTQQ